MDSLMHGPCVVEHCEKHARYALIEAFPPMVEPKITSLIHTPYLRSAG